MQRLVVFSIAASALVLMVHLLRLRRTSGIGNEIALFDTAALDRCLHLDLGQGGPLHDIGNLAVDKI